MASIKLTGDTSGEITISAPAVAGTNTLTLPAETGTLAQTTTGLIEVDMYRLNADITVNSDPISSNLERCDDASFAKIGTGMTESSGIFTFPRTGLYEVKVMATFNTTADKDNAVVQTYVTQDNGSNFDEVSRLAGSDPQTTCFGNAFVNVTDTSNVKVKFRLNSLDTGGALMGDSAYNTTAFTFIRLGDSQ